MDIKAKEHVLFDLSKKNKKTAKKKLEDYPVVKCAPDEKVLVVQRRHIISLIDTSIVSLLTLLLIIALIFSPIVFLRSNSVLAFYDLVSAMNISLTIISIYLLIQVLFFLTWYYQLYIITNKAILHRIFFRLNGEYSETVYAENLHVQDVDRKASNIIYDYFKIQDLYIYFHTLEREKPFVFKTPENAQKIDDVIQMLVLKSNGKKPIRNI